MNAEQFVAAMRREHIDQLISSYAQMFTDTSLESVTDQGMREIFEYWKAADETTRDMLIKLMRLASQNTLASVFSVLDNVSSQFSEDFTLLAKSSAGEESRMNGDLLDIFWAQEEEAGHVNASAT